MDTGGCSVALSGNEKKIENSIGACIACRAVSGNEFGCFYRE